MINFGKYSLVFDRTGSYEGRSLSGEDVEAIAYFYRLTSGRELDLEIAHVTWVNGERAVRLAERTRGPERLGRLLKGGRVGIYEGEDVGLPASTEWCQVRVMREKPGKELPTAVNVSYADMVRASGGQDVWGILADLGALAIGPQGHLLEGKSGRTPVITFPAGDPDVPVAAWALTKALPIINRFRG